jgi:hypothetical protein
MASDTRSCSRPSFIEPWRRGLIIRQFLSVKVERVMPNGRRVWIPRKNVYGIELGHGQWRPLSSTEIRDASNTDAASGRRLPPEDDVTYQEFQVKENQP